MAADPPRDSDARERDGNDAGAAPTVLVVEDEPALVALYRTWLSDTYDLRTASTVAAARSELDDSVDAVVLDRRLPDGVGEDVLGAVEARGLDCPVAMVTGVEPDFDVIEFGIAAYLEKPLDRDTVVSVVDRLVALREYDDAAREYFSLAAKRATLETAKPESALASSDHYSRLLDRLEAVEADARRSLAEAQDYELVFRALRDGRTAAPTDETGDS